MRIAIMQPYLFPYLGYFQLMRAVDKFVAYDDVAFIKQGWINRNYIMVNNSRHLFTVPVRKRSSFASINDTLVSEGPPRWESRLLATIRQAYAKAPYFENVFDLVRATVADSSGHRVSDVALDSIHHVWRYLGMTELAIDRSSSYGNTEFSGEHRVIDICERERAGVYVNSIGGTALYQKAAFAARGIELTFLNARLPEYKQFTASFVPGLSIIDVLMFNPPSVVVEFLDTYQLV